MKYLKQLSVILTVITLSFTATSCKKDKEDPTITVNTPAEHSHHKWGNEVHFDATFKDDRELKSYSVKLGDTDGNTISGFEFEASGTTNEAEHDFHSHFEVPTGAPMMAWLHFMVTDAEDKVATQKWMLHFEE